MSLTSDVTYVCGKCTHKNRAEKFDSINAQTSAELKEKLIKGTLFDVQCEKCGETFRLEYSCFFYDAEKKYKVYLRKEDGQTNPFGYNNNKEFTYRIVETYDQLREKVLILDSGLNDKAIEVAKQYVRIQYNEIKPDTVIVKAYCEGQKNDSIYFYLYLEDGQFFQSILPEAAYQKVINDNVFDINFDEKNDIYVVNSDWLSNMMAKKLGEGK